jgi:hypothetical protein
LNDSGSLLKMSYFSGQLPVDIHGLKSRCQVSGVRKSLT